MRECVYHLQLAPTPSFQERRALAPPSHETVEVLGDGTVPVNRFLAARICYTESLGKDSHRSATVKATRGQSKTRTELQGNATRDTRKKKLSIKKKKKDKNNIPNVY